MIFTQSRSQKQNKTSMIICKSRDS